MPRDPGVEGTVSGVHRLLGIALMQQRHAGNALLVLAHPEPDKVPHGLLGKAEMCAVILEQLDPFVDGIRLLGLCEPTHILHAEMPERRLCMARLSARRPRSVFWRSIRGGASAVSRITLSHARTNSSGGAHVSPWRRALPAAFVLPVCVRGPVLFRAFARFAVTCLAEVIRLPPHPRSPPWPHVPEMPFAVRRNPP